VKLDGAWLGPLVCAVLAFVAWLVVLVLVLTSLPR
jgi:hypothetical protein